MAGGAYISGIFQNHAIGERQGLRTKFFGEAWEPAAWEIPPTPMSAQEQYQLAACGFKLSRDQFPEAVAVWEEEAFAKTGDFLWAGPFLTVNAKVADVLRQFDLGEGELVPVPLFKADLETPWPDPYFYINYGGPKDTFLPEQSRAIDVLVPRDPPQKSTYDVFSPADGDIALSSAALDGAAIWIERFVWSKLFLGSELVDALVARQINVDLRLAKCRIVEG